MTTAFSCRLISLLRFENFRGRLDLANLNNFISDKVTRFFIVSGVPDGVTRGGHAHRSVEELLVVVKGRVRIDLRVGQDLRSVILDSSHQALYLPPMVWASQTFYDDAVMVVLASGEYDLSDHIDDFSSLSGSLDDFKEFGK